MQRKIYAKGRVTTIKEKMTKMIDDFLILYLTAEDCGACQHFRGNGIIGNGKEYMGYEKLESILKDGPLFLNIHYSIRNGKNSNIIDISRLVYKDKKILQEKCFKYENNIRVLVLEMEKDKKPRAIETSIVKEDKSDELVKWNEYIKNHVPKKLENFTGIYVPQVIVVKKKDWLKSINDESPFMAMTDRAHIVKKGEEWMISRDPRSVHQRATSIDIMIQEMKKGTFEFKEHMVDDGKAKPPVKNNTYRYIYYDDPE